MQAADIPDSVFLAIVRAINEGRIPEAEKEFRGVPGKGGAWAETGNIIHRERWAFVWDLSGILGLPEKLIRAKAKSLIKRGLMTGCPCGCRGDFEVDGLVTG